MNKLEMDVASRVLSGQKFNHYETEVGGIVAIGVGPVTAFRRLAWTDSQDAADLVAEALRRSLASDSGRPPQGEDGLPAECEAGQSGAAKTAHRPNSVDTAIEALTKAAEAFRAREAHFRALATCTPDDAVCDHLAAKATRNRLLAEQMEAALSTLIVPEEGAGRVQQAEPGSREPSPTVSAASGFDPSRDHLLGYHNMGSRGRCDWTHLREAVAEATSGLRCHSISFDPAFYPGHQMVSGINYNSLDRIVTAFVDAALVARDSDRSGEASETGTGSTEGESAGLQGIAQPHSGGNNG